MADEDRVKLSIWTINAGHFTFVVPRFQAESSVQEWQGSMDLGCLTVSGRLNDADLNPIELTIRCEQIVAIDILDVNGAL